MLTKLKNSKIYIPIRACGLQTFCWGVPIRAPGRSGVPEKHLYAHNEMWHQTDCRGDLQMVDWQEGQTIWFDLFINFMPINHQWRSTKMSFLTIFARPQHHSRFNCQNKESTSTHSRSFLPDTGITRSNSFKSRANLTPMQAD